MNDPVFKTPEHNDDFFSIKSSSGDFFSLEKDMISEYKKLNEQCDTIINKIKKRKSKYGE